MNERIKQHADNSPMLKQSLGTHSKIRWDITGKELANSLISQFGSNEVNRIHLADAAYLYANDQMDFIADQVAPVFPVNSLAGKYRKFDERMNFDRPDVKRGKDSPPAKINQGSEFENYDLSGRALSVYMSNVDRDDAVNQYGSTAKWRKVLTEQLTHLLLIDLEIEVADLLQTTGNYASGFTATATPLWSDASANFQENVMTGEDALYADRDVIVMGYDVYRQCQKSPQIKGASTVSSGSGKRKDNLPFVNLESISNFFDSEIVVGKARYNSSPESSTMTLSRIWANHAVIMHRGSGREFETPFARIFKLQSQTFPNVGGFTVKSVMDSSSIAGGELLMVGYWAQPKVFAQKAGYKLKCL